MLKGYMIAFCLLIVTLGASAQEAIRAQVADRESQEPLAFAWVNVHHGDTLLATSLTDEYGKTTVSVPGFPCRIEVVATGYTTYAEVIRKPSSEPLRVFMTRRFSSLDEVVVTGLTAPVKLRDALSSYQVISKAAMQAQGAVTAEDALKTQLNINMSSDNLLGAKTSLQGMKGDKVKVLIDGMPVNGRENGEVDLGQINLNNVEKIEIVQGPMSVVYGTDALGGVINIITAKNKAPWQISAGTYYESIGRYNFDVSGTYRFKDRHQFTLGGGRNFFQGWHPLDSLERSYLWKPKEQYLGNFAYSYTAKSSFRLQFASDFVREKISNKDGNYTINRFYARAFDEYYRNTRSMNRLQMSGKLGKTGHWQSQNSYSYYYRTKNRYQKDMVTLDQHLTEESGNQDTTHFDDFSFRGSYSDTKGKLDYTLGYDINLEHGESGKIGSGPHNIQDYAVYSNASFALFKKKLVVQPALRYAYNTAYKAPVMPSVHFLFHASEALKLRFSYARGFRAPSLKELHLHFYDSNHEIEGNPDLKAEQGHHLQLSGSWDMYKKQADYLRVLATAYYNDVFDQINLLLPDTMRPNYGYYANLDHFTNVILSLQTELQLGGFYLQGGYSYQHVLNLDSARYANTHQATATAQYYWKQTGISFATFYKYFGEQGRLSASIDGSTSFNGLMSAYSLWDASLSRRFIGDRVQLTCGVKNILDVTNAGVVGATSNTGGHNGSTDPGTQSITTGRSFFTSLRVTIP